MQEQDFKYLKAEIDSFSKSVLEQYKTIHPTLVDSNEVDVDIKQEAISVKLFLKDYAYYVEHGRKPSSKFPPLTSIQTWIQTKPVLPTQPKLAEASPTTGYSSLAYLIGRKIKNNGFIGDSKLEQIISNTFKAYEDKFKNALQKDTENYMVNLIPIKIT